MSKAYRHKIVVHVEGGIVQGVYVSGNPAEYSVLIVDEDNLKEIYDRDHRERIQVQAIDGLSEVQTEEPEPIKEQMTPTRACEIIKAEMDALRREKPNMPKSQMKRLGMRFDWNIIAEALQP